MKSISIFMIFLFISSIKGDTEEEAAKSTECYKATNPSKAVCQNQDRTQTVSTEINFSACCYEEYKKSDGTSVKDCYPITDEDLLKYNIDKTNFIKNTWAKQGETYSTLICINRETLSAIARATACNKVKFKDVSENTCQSSDVSQSNPDVEYVACCYEEYKINGVPIKDCYPIEQYDLDYYKADINSFIINNWAEEGETYDKIVCNNKNSSSRYLSFCLLTLLAFLF